ncbi:peptidoglycan-binding protein [Bradyrhizobium sp. Pear76]|uniref:peptidoglycan-binding protein n=1 Tax=Bradyrhizobium oropedii TaxID=1571201 RepID=UPI001E48F31E|nr:peptidoglycan-binding protein [Bradyrhizobium oropedii]MCC8968179.1 peptidoglycan-binding protein [Bradyrhizobium oropedii]
MQHPFKALAAEYAAYLAHMTVTPGKAAAIDAAAKKILRPENLDVYVAACQGTAIPPAFIGALELRESDCDPTRALGQGDRWDRVSVNVPRGKGPFKSRLDAMKFYIRYDGLDQNSSPWSMEYACWKGEGWNGFGPRAHGRATGYLWAGTSIYDKPTGKGGKYVSDGEWSPSTYDVQHGIVPVLLRIGQLRTDLAIGSALPIVEAPSIVPDVAPAPVGVGGGFIIDVSDINSVKALQAMLNDKHALPDPITVDGSYGRETRAAVRAYQMREHLTVDGLAGPETLDHLGLARV